jgi:hypothetical protein
MEIDDGVGQIGKILGYIDETRVSFQVCREENPVDVELSVLRETKKTCEDSVPEAGTIFAWLPDLQKQGFNVTLVSSAQEANMLYADMRTVNANSVFYPCADIPSSMIAAAKIAKTTIVTDPPYALAISNWYSDNLDEVGVARQVVGDWSKEIKIESAGASGASACEYLQSKDAGALLAWKVGGAAIQTSGEFVSAWSVDTLVKTPKY